MSLNLTLTLCDKPQSSFMQITTVWKHWQRFLAFGLRKLTLDLKVGGGYVSRFHVLLLIRYQWIGRAIEGGSYISHFLILNICFIAPFTGVANCTFVDFNIRNGQGHNVSKREWLYPSKFIFEQSVYWLSQSPASPTLSVKNFTMPVIHFSSTHNFSRLEYQKSLWSQKLQGLD